MWLGLAIIGTLLAIAELFSTGGLSVAASIWQIVSSISDVLTGISVFFGGVASYLSGQLDIENADGTTLGEEWDLTARISNAHEVQFVTGLLGSLLGIFSIFTTPGRAAQVFSTFKNIIVPALSAWFAHGVDVANDKALIDSIP